MQINLKAAESVSEVFDLNKLLPSALATCLALAATAAFAQESGNDATVIEEVVVTGTRSTIQSSIETKRLADNIVEALSAEDIGDIPALSIGEALETLTSAASHREQGGATEISIRGLGPFLGSTTLNGREATNGSGDRSVNFSQFPSELFNKLAIYKTQQASLVEGAFRARSRWRRSSPSFTASGASRAISRATTTPTTPTSTSTNGLGLPRHRQLHRSIRSERVWRAGHFHRLSEECRNQSRAGISIQQRLSGLPQRSGSLHRSVFQRKLRQRQRRPENGGGPANRRRSRRECALHICAEPAILSPEHHR